MVKLDCFQRHTSFWPNVLTWVMLNGNGNDETGFIEEVQKLITKYNATWIVDIQEIHFENESDAALFLLTWSGHDSLAVV